jgi:hypothetical protein
MMKEFNQSFILFAPCPAPCRAARRFIGPLRTMAKMSARGFPLGTIPHGRKFSAKSILCLSRNQ